MGQDTGYEEPGAYRDEPEEFRNEPVDGFQNEHNDDDQEMEEMEIIDVDDRPPRRISTRKKRIKEDLGLDADDAWTWRRICFYGSLCLLASTIIASVVIGVMYALDDDEPQMAASCGNCWCRPDEIVKNCPSQVPPDDFSVDFITKFLQQEPVNALSTLTCDPFQDSTCKPDQQVIGFGPNAVCGLHYNDQQTCTRYELQTYETKDMAEAAGAFVTHLGPCGVCSTTHDLGVLMEYEPDLFTRTEKCTSHSIKSVPEGKKCFENLGFTSPCATLRAQQGHAYGRHCLVTCQTADLRDLPFNDKDTCALNDCLQCQEDRAGTTFALFAGRTMRSSGLISSIARKCSEIASIQHRTCPPTRIMNFPN